MELTLNRDSVSMGDDTWPHLLALTLPDDTTLEQAIAAIDGAHWLAQVQGGATWLVLDASHGNRALAVFRLGQALYLTEPQILLRELGASPSLFFEYHLGRDPELLRDEQLGNG